MILVYAQERLSLRFNFFFFYEIWLFLVVLMHMNLHTFQLWKRTRVHTRVNNISVRQWMKLLSSKDSIHFYFEIICRFLSLSFSVYWNGNDILKNNKIGQFLTTTKSCLHFIILRYSSICHYASEIHLEVYFKMKEKEKKIFILFVDCMNELVFSDFNLLNAKSSTIVVLVTVESKKYESFGIISHATKRWTHSIADILSKQLKLWNEILTEYANEIVASSVKRQNDDVSTVLMTNFSILSSFRF